MTSPVLHDDKQSDSELREKLAGMLDADALRTVDLYGEAVADRVDTYWLSVIDRISDGMGAAASAVLELRDSVILEDSGDTDEETDEDSAAAE